MCRLIFGVSAVIIPSLLGSAMAAPLETLAVQGAQSVSLSSVPTLNPWAVLVALSGSEGAAIICDPVPTPLGSKGSGMGSPTGRGNKKGSKAASPEPCLLPDESSTVGSKLPTSVPPEESPALVGLLPLLLGTGAAAGATAGALALGGGGNTPNSPV